MKNYIRPNMELSKFDVADIITVSGEVVKGAALTEDAGTLYEAYLDTSSKKYDDVTIFEW